MLLTSKNQNRVDYASIRTFDGNSIPNINPLCVCVCARARACLRACGCACMHVCDKPFKNYTCHKLVGCKAGTDIKNKRQTRCG